MTPQPIDPAIQLARFRAAVQLLGGKRSAARALTINERHVGRLLAGGSPLHSGILTDLGTALLAHADQCRALERQISPAFAANLIDGQLAPPKPRGRWTGKSPAENALADVRTLAALKIGETVLVGDLPCTVLAKYGGGKR